MRGESVGQIKPRVDPAREAPFRRGYCQGWAAATKALQKLLEARNLSPSEGARVLEAHHADALAKWRERERDDVALYPPAVPGRR
jgi:hypothetical protein